MPDSRFPGNDTDEWTSTYRLHFTGIHSKGRPRSRRLPGLPYYSHKILFADRVDAAAGAEGDEAGAEAAGVGAAKPAARETEASPPRH
jgi:hypothetical protein